MLPHYQGAQALLKRCPALRVGLRSGRQCASSRLGQRREEAGQWKFAKPSDDFHHIVGLSSLRACTPWTLQPSLGATLVRVLIKLYPPASYRGLFMALAHSFLAR